MALGDGIRRNITSITQQERDRFRDAIIALNKTKFFPGSRTDFPAGGVSYWFKQDEIHQATHIHGTPAFLPWHRELCNRFEAMLREVDPELSLHYWDWNQDPTPLFTANFMGNAQGDVGEPWLGAGLYNPNPNPADNYRDDQVHYLQNRAGNTSYQLYSNPADPPKTLTRNTQLGPPPVGTSNFEGVHWATDSDFMNAADFPAFDSLMQVHGHGLAHDWIGGNLGNQHMSFRDPFVFLLHSNVDRLWATWQTQPGHPERLDPNLTYGSYSLDPTSTASLEPWAGEDGWQAYPDNMIGYWPTRPWYSPENQQVTKTSKDLSVVTPPRYDTNLRAGVHQLYYNNSSWVDQDLTASANGPWVMPGFGVSSFASSDVEHLYYVAGTPVPQYVHQLITTMRGWVDQDLTAWAHGTPVLPTSDFSSFADAAGEHVYYTGGDWHVHQLYYNNSSWVDQDLTAWTHGPFAMPGSLSSFADAFGEHVYYLGGDSHVHQLYYNNSSWVDQDLTAWANGPSVMPGNSFSSFADAAGEHVYYTGTDSHVHQLITTIQGWVDQDLTAWANGPSVMSGSGLSSFADAAGEHVYYLGGDSHVHQLYYNNSSWVDQDLTASANGPWVMPGSRFSSFADAVGEHVYYLGLY